MSELHKFLFDGLPVRGMVVRLTDAWQEILARRASNSATGAYPPPVAELLGEMTAAATLMQSNIKFNGALILQIFGDGPVKVAVAEVKPDLSLRATAKVVGDLPANARLPEMVNVHNKGRCAITLDPKDRMPGQQPYQGVVPLNASHGEGKPDMAAVLEHYMRQSEQLDTRLVLAANESIAAGLLIQRLPVEGEGNIAKGQAMDPEEQMEHFNRIAMLTASLTSEELLGLDVETILRRLYWQEKILRFDPQTPRFACTCSRERVAGMIRGLGQEEADGIVAERGEIDVTCDFCGQHYRFDAVDTVQL
ncbi:MAG: Hsp33 family molecular chaperone HslO, partial [Comamonadaceae bacterium]